MLAGLTGILDGQWMQIELPLHPLQKIVTGLEQPDLDDRPGCFDDSPASSIVTSVIFLLLGRNS